MTWKVIELPVDGGFLAMHAHMRNEGTVSTSSFTRDQNVAPAVRRHSWRTCSSVTGPLLAMNTGSPSPRSLYECGDGRHEQTGCQRPQEHFVEHGTSPSGPGKESIRRLRQF